MGSNKLTLLLLTLALCGVDSKSYVGHCVVKITNINRSSDAHLIETIATEHRDDVIYWTDDALKVGKDFSILVSPKMKAEVLGMLRDRGMETEVMLEDVNVLLQMERRRAKAADDCIIENSGYNGQLTFDAYYDTEVFYEYFDYLEETYDYVSQFSIGESYEGRDMKILQICKNGPCGSSRYGMWVDAGIHAREWIAPATAAYLAQELVENDAAHPDLTENLDWYILPVMNPDGYAFTRQVDGDRFWRMTRSLHEGTDCIGTDANRNWGYEWGPEGSSYLPCNPSQTYHGPYPFSEIEILNAATFMNTTMPSRGPGKIVFTMAIHSYMQAILLPWSYTGEEEVSYLDEIKNIAEPAAEAMSLVDGRDYVVDTIPNLVGETAGSVVDWALAEAGVKYAFGMELRGGPLPGLGGFVLPSEEICPNSREVFEFHQSIARDIFDEFGVPEPEPVR